MALVEVTITVPEEFLEGVDVRAGASGDPLGAIIIKDGWLLLAYVSDDEEFDTNGFIKLDDVRADYYEGDSRG